MNISPFPFIPFSAFPHRKNPPICTTRYRTPRLLLSGLALAGCSLLAIPSASAATRTWGGGNLLWNNTTASGWNAAAPLAADTAIINSGTVTFHTNDIYGNAANTSSAAITVNTGGTLASGPTFNSLWNLTLGGGTLLSNGGVNAGFGTFNLAGTVTAAASVTSTISTGTGSFNLINLGNGGSAAVTNTTFNVGAAGTLNVGTVLQNHRYFSGGTVTSVAGLIKTGDGEMNLNAINTYTGTTAVNAGTLRLGHLTNTLANTGAVTIGGGTLDLGINTDTVGAVTLTSGSITGTGTAAQGVLTGTSYALQSGSVSAKLGGTGVVVTKTTGGIVTLSGANTYTGATTISDGTLSIGDGGTTGSLNPLSSITNNATLTFNRSNAIVQGTAFAQGITGTGNVTQAGTGKTTLNGTNTYTGVTTVSAGTLQFATQGSLYNNNTVPGVGTGWTAANINVKSAATLAVNVDSAGTAGFTSGSIDTLLTNISVANTAAEGLQAGAILGFDTSTATAGTFTQGTVAITNSTGASGGAVGVTKLGAGTLVLDESNTYTGTTTVDAGTLKVDNDGATVSGRLTGSNAVGSIVVNNSGTLLLAGAGNNDRIGDTTGITLDGGTLGLDPNVNVSEGVGAQRNGPLPGNVTGTSSVGLGVLTLSANSTLDFGTGSFGTLVFTTFAPGAFTLNILNYTSAASGLNLNQSGISASDDRLIFNHDVSGSSLLGNISFNGVGAAQISLDSGYYEIVPVPEPATTALIGAVALCALIGYRERRRFSRKRGANTAV